MPVDVLVRRDALRDRRNDEPMSVTEDAIECLLACLRCCGVVGTLALVSYWLATGRGLSGAAWLGVGRVSAGGEKTVVFAWEMEREEREALACPLGPLKKEGRREKKLGVECDGALDSLRAWSAIVGTAIYRSRGSHSGGSGADQPASGMWGGCTCALNVAMREGARRGYLIEDARQTPGLCDGE